MSSSDNPTLIVLDTNVCLDLFVFRDPRLALLLNALQTGSAKAVTRADCREEWRIVLTYPKLSLDDASRARSAAEFDSLITCLPPSSEFEATRRLPVCRDPDDQKFLELACDAGAEVLVTKDKALLRLAKKTSGAGLFAIMTPDAWAHGANAPVTNKFRPLIVDPA